MNVKERKKLSKRDVKRGNDFNCQKSSKGETSGSDIRKSDGKEKSYSSCYRCSKNHLGKCLAGTKNCYSCGKSRHNERVCLVAFRKGRDSNKARCEGGNSQSKYGGGFSGSTIPKCSKCGKNHREECLAGLDVCYRSGKPGHYARECRRGTRPQA
ncbi:uncharacterized protein LOC129892681 [Solanum dulcamara]|uniref:uncharacterized protein LOC129892681 n=1 Tax=Solanum dulcamara TaxID=45834 RepID=UPI00248606B5|nr:uncharacterized protein LOC129892681 [Solanum dulcamara]